MFQINRRLCSGLLRHHIISGQPWENITNSPLINIGNYHRVVILWEQYIQIIELYSLSLKNDKPINYILFHRAFELHCE